MRSRRDVNQISDDFVLPVDRDGFAARELRHVDAMATPFEADEDAFVPEPALFEAVAGTNRAQQIDRALLEHTGSHAIDDVLAIAVFDDDRVDAVEMKKVSEQQTCRTRADDADLSPHRHALRRRTTQNVAQTFRSAFAVREPIT